jgi:hypothetical protein
MPFHFACFFVESACRISTNFGTDVFAKDVELQNFPGNGVLVEETKICSPHLSMKPLNDCPSDPSHVNLPFTCPCITNISPNYNQQDVTFLDFSKKLNNIRQAQLFIYYCAATCFDLFNRSSSGLVTLRVNKCYVHIGIPVCSHC